eukprot:XP_011619088.1 PREDICTED: sialic acid-binding Ig-like lectin 11 isoform X2 [Takifugu rubripes]
MAVLTWIILLVLVNTDKGSSVMLRKRCMLGFCVSFPEEEIKAEAGLCVVIPCSFSTSSSFTPQNMVWFKCDASKSKCAESDIIFHPNRRKVQDGFRERVSLLEPDLSLENCSIIVNDLTESDSGSYQLRLNGLNYYGNQEGFTFPVRAFVSAKALSQKPTVTVPPLTEGQQGSLTCTAPGLCSGSDPKITWTWTEGGKEEFRFTGNISVEKMTEVTRKMSSTLTFNSLAESHDANVTCAVRYRNNITTLETVTLNVTYVKEIEVSGALIIREGETLNLTCSLDSFPPSVLTWTKSPETTETFLQINSSDFYGSDNNSRSFQQEQRDGMASFSLSNVTAEDSGQYICTAKHLNMTLMERVDIKVIYMRSLVMSDDRTVEEGNSLNLTCWVESYPLSRIRWTKLGSSAELNYEVSTDQENNKMSALLLIPDVTTEDSGRYICEAAFLETSVSSYTDIMVTIFPRILKSSGCKLGSKVLTCVCVSQGIPLPSIKWRRLGNHTEYTVITTVSKNTINSTFSLSANDKSNPAVECVSSNSNGEIKETLITTEITTPEVPVIIDPISKGISWPEVTIAFLIGVILSAAICYLFSRC